MAYVSLCKALYDYAAVAEDELSFTEDAVLYILDASDAEWWKAKLKSTSEAEEEQVGLVPANYVEEATPTRQSRALYDYAAQTHEELTLAEDQLLNVYEDDDDDWILVRSADDQSGKLGFVPKNYVDEVAAVDGETGLGAPIEAAASDARDDEAPTQQYASPPATPIAAAAAPPRLAAAAPAAAPANDKGDAIQMWGVSMLDGKKKKRKGTLGIGNASLFFASESDKQPVQKISITHVLAHTLESKGKQINLDLDEAAGVEENTMRFVLNAKGEAEEVAEKIEASKTRAEAVAAGTASPAAASKTAPRMVPPPLASPAATKRMSTATASLPPPSRGSSALAPPPQRNVEAASPVVSKTNGHGNGASSASRGEAAIALYDFEAQGDDELSVAENEKLTLVERENDDWWKVRNARGAEGVVPASYVEVTGGAGGEAEDDDDDAAAAAAAAEEEEERQRQQAAMEATRRTREAAARRAREAEERRREALKAQPAPAPPKAAPTTNDSARAAARDVSIPSGRSAPARPADGGGKSRPNPARTRMWVDRTGAFKVEAEFLGFNQGKIRLHKLNGVVIEVAVEKMSNPDIAYLEDVTGKRLAPSSTARASAGPRTAASASRPAGGAGGDREREKRKEAEREARRRQQSARGPKRNVDWFEFFLAAGVDVDDCTRYAAAFERDNIDEAILPDMEPGVLRSLGLREGDIIRVDKFIRRKYRREEGAGASSGAPKDREAQVKADEELARKLQGQEQSARRGASTSPAPNLFSGPDGSLKNNTRRGRPAGKGAAQPGGVDAASIAAVASDLARTTSPPQLPTRSANNSPAIIASAGAAARKGAATPSGFDDDAWTPRPSSTKPATPKPAPPVVVAAAASPAPPAPVAPTPPPAPAAPAAPAAPTPPVADPNSALFDKLAAMRPPSSGFAQRPGASPLGSVASSSPVNSFGARGPLAPVAANQGLLQPLISTQGTGVFVPTRPGGLQAQATGWGGMQPQQTGFAGQGGFMQQQQQPMQTGYAGGMQPQQTGFGMQQQQQQPMQTGFGGMGMGMGLQPQATGFHPGVGISNVSGFGGGMLAPQMTAMPQQQQQQQMQPQATGIQLPQQNGGAGAGGDKFGAANIFGQMKQGTLHQDSNAASQPPQRYDALRPQPTGFQPGGVMGVNPQFTGFQQQQPQQQQQQQGYGQQGYGYQQY